MGAAPLDDDAESRSCLSPVCVPEGYVCVHGTAGLKSGKKWVRVDVGANSEWCPLEW